MGGCQIVSLLCIKKQSSLEGPLKSMQVHRGYTQNSKRDTKKVFKPIGKAKGEKYGSKAHSLSHTKWMCKYHIVFTPKYRRKVIYNQYRSSLGEIFHRLCSYKGVEIIEGHLMPDHVHMLVSIPPRISVASFMGYLKVKVL